MNNLFKNIEINIKNAFSEYIELISEKYNIDKKDLENILQNNSIKIENSKKETPVKEKVNATPNIENTEGCPYIFTKGENKGDKCNSKPKTNCEYCSKHQKFEGVGQVEKKKLPKAKSISSASSVASKKGKTPEKKQIEKIIRLNSEIDRWWNVETELVFKSRDERYVVGSYRNGKINELTSDDILLCEQYGFKYKIEKEDNIEKKSIAAEINKTNLYAKDIENILHELQVDNNSEADFDDNEYLEEDEILDEDY